MPYSVLLVLTGLLMNTPSHAGAECRCLCMDGSYRTLCTSLVDAQAGVDACAGTPPRTCPARPDGPVKSYAPPEAGADNCRDAQVFDRVAGEHITVKVCDVLPSS